MKRPPSRKSGLTLVELLIASAITGIVLTGAFTAMAFIQRSLDNSKKSANSLTIQSLTLDYLVRDIRSCQGANIDQNGRRLRLLLPREYEEHKTFSNPQSITADGVAYPGGNVTVTYHQLNGILRRFDSLGKTEEIIPSKYGADVSFLPASMTMVGSVVSPITVTVTARPSAGLGLTKGSLASSTMSLVVAPSLPRKVFTP